MSFLDQLDEVSHPPVTINQTKSNPEKPNPKLGASIVTFSCNGRYLVTRNGIFLVSTF